MGARHLRHPINTVSSPSLALCLTICIEDLPRLLLHAHCINFISTSRPNIIGFHFCFLLSALFKFLYIFPHLNCHCSAYGGRLFVEEFILYCSLGHGFNPSSLCDPTWLQVVISPQNLERSESPKKGEFLSHDCSLSSTLSHHCMAPLNNFHRLQTRVVRLQPRDFTSLEWQLFCIYTSCSSVKD